MIAKAPVVKLEVPGTVKMPDCVIAPPALIVKFWPIVEAANSRAPLLVKDTLLAPLLLRLTAPPKEFAWVRVMGLAPAVKEAVPPTDKAPLCVRAPEIIVRFCPIVEAANCKAPLVVSEALLEPLLLRVTAPVKALLCVKVMALAPPVKLEVPPTVKAPA